MAKRAPRKVRLRGGAVRRLGKRGRFGPLLLKEVAREGAFTDQDGQQVTLDRPLLEAAVRGTDFLMAHGFSVRCFLGHDTVHPTDIRGTWRGIAYYPERRGVWAVLEAHGDDAAAELEPLDTSIVLEVDVALPNGRSAPCAITRIDAVDQGAVVGTAPFARLRAGRYTMTTPIIRALARLSNLDDAATIEQVDEALMRLAAEGGPDAVDAIAEEVKRSLMSAAETPPAAPPAPPADDEDPRPATAMGAEGGETIEELRARLRRVEGQLKASNAAQLDGLYAQVEDPAARLRLKRLVSKMTDGGADPALAVEAVREAISLQQSSAPTTRVQARPSQLRRPEAPEAERARTRLSRAAERVFGPPIKDEEPTR